MPRARLYPLIRTCVAMLMAFLCAVVPAAADFVIREARIGQGDLWVSGEVDEPNSAITLDDSFGEKTDQQGRFEFRLPYHPATCTVLLKAGQQVRPVVIENCGQRGPPGPPGPPAAVATADTVVEPARSCGAKAALYTERNLAMWVTRRGAITYENPLRPLSKETLSVFEVMVAGRPATAYGPDANSLQRAGTPKELEQTLGGTIAWTPGGEMPDALQIVSATGEVVARLGFKECGDVPKQLDRAQSRAPQAQGTGGGSNAAPKPGAGSEPVPKPDAKRPPAPGSAAKPQAPRAPNRGAASQAQKRAAQPPPPASAPDASEDAEDQ
jgi:hypothetical protein